jgi:hypothetical protein
MAAGRIKEMLISAEASGLNGGLVTIEVFKLGEHLHPDFEMPILCQPVTEYCTVQSQVSDSFLFIYLFRNGKLINITLADFTVFTLC